MQKEVSALPPQKLPGDIFSALDLFSGSAFMVQIMGKENHRKYADLKKMAADRSPQNLGTKVKLGEILYHHEVTNQFLWSDF